jgi:hypothetical protein
MSGIAVSLNLALNIGAVIISVGGMVFSVRQLLRWRSLRDDWERHDARMKIIAARIDEIQASDRLILHFLADLLYDPHIAEPFKVNIAHWLELRGTKVSQPPT